MRKWKGTSIKRLPADTLPDDWTGVRPTTSRISAERRLELRAGELKNSGRTAGDSARDADSIPPPFLQRAQEVQEVLSLRIAEVVKIVHDTVSLGRLVLGISRALVPENRLDQIGGASVMKKKDALPQTP